MKLKSLRSVAISFLLIFGILTVTLPQTACGPNDVHTLKVDLNKAAKTLNGAAKENRLLYEAKVFGDQALTVRKKVASAIGDANEVLKTALDIAKHITPATFTGDKEQILTLLGQAVSTLAAAHIGNDKVDLLLQGAAAAINSAIVLVQALKSVELRIVVPQLQSINMPVIVAD